MLYPKKTSLYEVLHSSSVEDIDYVMKLRLLLGISNIFSLLHDLEFFHGHLSPHNIFVELPTEDDETSPALDIKIAELETKDLQKYENMFHNYRPISVWSSPESLKQPKKLPDSTTANDVYSYGMIMWEVFHQSVPFDGDTQAATDIVLKDDARPLINADIEVDNSLMAS